MAVRIDWERARAVCGHLLQVYRSADYPYSEEAALPQAFITDAIKRDPLTHARFLFYCCHYMRGSIKSDLAVKLLVVLWERRPEFFDPLLVARLTDTGALASQLRELLMYKYEEIAKAWVENSRRLARHWDGDPRRIFDGVTEASLMYRRITNKAIRGERPSEADHPEQGFIGFQEKMASMLAYFLMDAGLVAHFTASPPVDFHLLRVMFATGILVPEKHRTATKLRYEHAFPKGIEVLEAMGKEGGVSLVELGNAFWMLSVVLCSTAPGNLTTGRQKGENGKKVHPVPVEVSWDDEDHVRRYLRSCGLCPLEGECRTNVFSGTYYQTGELGMRPRLRLDAAGLFPLFTAEHLPGQARPSPPPVPGTYVPARERGRAEVPGQETLFELRVHRKESSA